jgi:16S rRNA (cytosine1402-N4)-methyltransferase
MSHLPVMRDEVLTQLAPRDGGCYVDATFGAGGYSRAVLEHARCRVAAFDRDPSVATHVEALQRDFPGRLTWHNIRYSQMERVLRPLDPEGVDGVMFDVGVSSMQLDTPERGFSFRFDAPLDMRMGEGCETTAAEILNTRSEATLMELFFRLGEEPESRRIARAIVVDRATTPFTTTTQLAELVARIVRRREKHIHPATQVFQALRIAVNRELEELEEGLAAAASLLKPKGRMVVVSFHSLEDRVVKRFCQRYDTQRQTSPSRHIPLASDAPALPYRFRNLTRKAITPSEQEMRDNPRARSAKLRAVEVV